MLKKILIALLCACTLTTLTTACDRVLQGDGQSSDTTMVMDERDDLSKKYYSIEKNGDKTVYYIYDKDGNTALEDESEGEVTISMLDDSTVDICVTTEERGEIHRYYNVKNDLMSEEFSLVAAAGFDHIAYLKGEGFDMVLVVQHIFDKNQHYEERQENLNFRYNNPVVWAEFTENASALNITLYDYSGDIITQTVPVTTSAEDNQIYRLYYWSIGNGTCRVGALENIDSVSIPSTSPYGEKIVKIGSFCFYQNKSLKAVVIPNTVSEIGNYAFEGCTNLETVIFRGTEEQWEKVTGRENIPSSVNIVFEE